MPLHVFIAALCHCMPFIIISMPLISPDFVCHHLAPSLLGCWVGVLDVLVVLVFMQAREGHLTDIVSPGPRIVYSGAGLWFGVPCIL